MQVWQRRNSTHPVREKGQSRVKSSGEPANRGEVSTGIAPYALDADNAERLWEVSVRLLPAHGWITEAA